MAEQMFEVSAISLDGAVEIIYGNGAPGNSVQSNASPVGSKYSNTLDGSQWSKTANNGGTGDWIELAGKDAAIMVEHIASTGVILDQLPTQLASEFAWMVTAYNEADESNKYSALVHMAHNGTSTADATGVTFDLSSVLRMGPKIQGLTLTGTLSGSGANQFMNLHVSSTTMVTFVAYRMVKNVAGSRTIVLGGANLDAHITDGTVHMTAAQNTLMDGLSASLTSTQVNTLVGVTGSIQGQLDSKADTGHIHTIANVSGLQPALDAKLNSSNAAVVATSGSYNDLSNKPTYATVATSGSYNDLSNKPVFSVPSTVSSFTNDANYATTTQLAAVQTFAATKATSATTLAGYGITDAYTRTQIDTSLAGKQATLGAGSVTNAMLANAAVANLSGTNTGDQTSVTGNAGTATRLQTARTINGVAFDGSANITVNAVDNTSGYQTAAQVTTAINAKVVPYDIVGSVYGAPANAESVFRFITPRAFSMLNTGSICKADIASTGTATLTVLKNGSSIGTFTFSAGNVTATASLTTTSFVVGDKFEITAPATADATLADINFAILGTLPLI